MESLSGAKHDSERCTAGLCEGALSHSPLSRCILFLLAMIYVPLSLISNPLMLERAEATTWPLYASRLSSSLAFHVAYEAGGRRYVHSGIDIDAPTGSDILLPRSGVVSFVGRVPSGDSSFGADDHADTMLAVSVRIPDGRVLTFMPLLRADVTEGAHIEEGNVIGTLAKSGDRSSAEPHLHIGLKKNGTYDDPMSLFSASLPETEDEGALQSAQMTPKPVPAVTGASPLVVSQKTQGSGQATSALSDELGTVSSGDAVWEPARFENPSPLADVGVWASDIFQDCLSQAAALHEALDLLAVRVGMPAIVLVLGFGAMGLAVLLGFLFLCVRWAFPFIRCLASVFAGYGKNPGEKHDVKRLLVLHGRG